MSRSRKTTHEFEETAVESPTENQETTEVASHDEPSPVIEEKVSETDGGKEPAVVALGTSSDSTAVSETLSKESVEAMMQERLSRRTDEAASDPFVPQNQLDNEVKDIAKKSGFPLTRGTEIGARLIARSQRKI